MFFSIYSGQWGGLVEFQLQKCHVQQMKSLSLHYHLNLPFSYSLVPACFITFYSNKFLNTIFFFFFFGGVLSLNTDKAHTLVDWENNERSLSLLLWLWMRNNSNKQIVFSGIWKDWNKLKVTLELQTQPNSFHKINSIHR